MSSFFTWIDHSESERRRMLDALEMFRERNTRDELGLASVRDAFSDLLFPGTGSLQRRARYFFFVPWMFQQLESERVSSAQMPRRVWQFEVKLINALAESDDKEGIIGIQKRQNLQRFPSSIYWNGLRRLGIRLCPGTQEDYYRSLDAFYRQSREIQRDDDKQPIGRIQTNWRPGMPPIPLTFPETASTALTVREADYLAERIAAEASASVFAFFVTRYADPSDKPFIWDHALANDLPAALKEQVAHARSFAEVMQGAVGLYNVLLARMRPQQADVLGKVEQAFAEWRDDVIGRLDELRKWDLTAMWRLHALNGAQIPPPTSAFVDGWFALFCQTRDPNELLSSRAAADLITQRERRLKRKLARLTNDDARQRWNGASGLGRLEYRWLNARMVLNDIVQARRAHARTA